MKLLTQALKNQFKKVGRQDGKGDPKDRVVIAKFFLPEGAATWLALEGEQDEDGDWQFFGYVTLWGDFWELGYFNLSELSEVRSKRFRLPVERDLHCAGQTARKLMGGGND